MGDGVKVDEWAVRHELQYALRQISYATDRPWEGVAARDALDRARQAIDAALALVRPVPDEVVENEF